MRTGRGASLVLVGVLLASAPSAADTWTIDTLVVEDRVVGGSLGLTVELPDGWKLNGEPNESWTSFRKGRLLINLYSGHSNCKHGEELSEIAHPTFVDSGWTWVGHEKIVTAKSDVSHLSLCRPLDALAVWNGITQLSLLVNGDPASLPESEQAELARALPEFAALSERVGSLTMDYYLTELARTGSDSTNFQKGGSLPLPLPDGWRSYLNERIYFNEEFVHLATGLVAVPYRWAPDARDCSSDAPIVSLAGMETWVGMETWRGAVFRGNRSGLHDALELCGAYHEPFDPQPLSLGLDIIPYGTAVDFENMSAAVSTAIAALANALATTPPAPPQVAPAPVDPTVPLTPRKGGCACRTGGGTGTGGALLMLLVGLILGRRP